MWRSFLLKATLFLCAFNLPVAGQANEKFETNSITPNFLVVYFHSYGGNYLEAFVQPSPQNSIVKNLVKDIPGVMVLTVDRNPTAALTGSDGYRSVSQQIMQCHNMYPSLKHIVLCGTSLGAYETLTYPYYAPKPIFDKISGIITVEPTDDLAELYWKTASPKVRSLVFYSCHGDPKEQPDFYRTHSVKTIWSQLPDRPDLKVWLVSARRDVVVPPYQQKRLATTLRQKKMTVNLVQIDRQHSIADGAVYGAGLHFVTGR